MYKIDRLNYHYKSNDAQNYNKNLTIQNILQLFYQKNNDFRTIQLLCCL